MPELNEAVIISAARTPVGKFLGSLKSFSAPQLGAIVVRESVKRANVRPEDVDEVIMGCVIQAGLGQNPARQAALKGGIPFGVSAVTINKVCGSGLKSVMMAAQGIQLGDTGGVVAERYHVSREEQDEYALNSHRKAAAAMKAGKFKDEILPVEIPQKKGPALMFDTDETVREDTTAEVLAKLKPAFKTEGTVTA